MSLTKAAANILQRATELDTKGRYTEALISYQEGIQLLLDIMKGKVQFSIQYKLISIRTI